MSIDGIGILVYIVVIRFYTNYDLSIRLTATLIGVIPFVLKAIYGYIMASIYGYPLSNAITQSDIIIALGQLVFAFIIMYFLQKNNEDIANWFIIALFGALINYILIPFVVPMFAAY